MGSSTHPFIWFLFVALVSLVVFQEYHHRKILKAREAAKKDG